MRIVSLKNVWLVLALCLSLAGASCKSQESLPHDARTAQADKEVRARWGKGISELPAVKLVLISPHNENITTEYTWAFTLYYAREFGQRVELEWRDVGGGGSQIERYLFGIYANSDSADIDVLWGGGVDMYIRMARASEKYPQGLLEKLDLPPDVLAQIGSPGGDSPNTFAGLPFYDKDLRWVGSAISSFGFLCNSGMIAKCGLKTPRTWQEVGGAGFTDLVTLADPSQSASVARSYQLIVQSAPTWQQGWAGLMQVLSNAKRFSDSAGSAANAPVLGDCMIASCIDFYGLMRVAEAPGELAYVNPPGQTTFEGDPIAIPKNPPNRQLAQRFVDFVMSIRGQAMWILKPGQDDGPARSALGRVPIRRDVFTIYKDRIPAGVNFYESQQLMTVSPEVAKVSFPVLRQLTASAAVDNVDHLRMARKRLNELAGSPSTREQYARALEDFNRLPDNVATVEKMAEVEKRLKDPLEFYNITRGWRDFFRDKFQRIASQ